MSELDARKEILIQMANTYSQEMSVDRLRGYLAIIEDVPTHRLADAIRDAAKLSGAFMPGPGEIQQGWKSIRAAGPGERSPDPHSRTHEMIAAGGTVGQLAAALDGKAPAELREVIALSKKLLKAHPHRFPPNDRKRTASFVRACMQLERPWPMEPSWQALIGEEMRALGERGSWWDTPERHKVTG